MTVFFLSNPDPPGDVAVGAGRLPGSSPFSPGQLPRLRLVGLWTPAALPLGTAPRGPELDCLLGREAGLGVLDAKPTICA